MHFGWRRIGLWFLLVIGLTLVLGYAAEQPLYFAHEEASHTHAFDEWTSPFSGPGAPWELVASKLMQKAGMLEIPSLIGIALLVLAGAALRIRDAHGRLEAWLTQTPSPTEAPLPFWNRGVPGPVLGMVLGMVALGGLIAFSIAAVYLYYPAPELLFVEMKDARINTIYAVKAGNKEEATQGGVL
jgi:hypothetical protein